MFLSVRPCSEKTTLALWDCSGAERYRPTLQSLYSAASSSDPVRGAMLFYDMTSTSSFAELSYWYNEMLRCCPGAALMIVGTKSDNVDALKIASEDGAKQAAEWGATHLTISAKTGLNVDGMCALMLALIKKAAQSA